MKEFSIILLIVVSLALGFQGLNKLGKLIKGKRDEHVLRATNAAPRVYTSVQKVTADTTEYTKVLFKLETTNSSTSQEMFLPVGMTMEIELRPVVSKTVNSNGCWVIRFE